DRYDAPGGVWACPVVKAAGTGGSLHLVNTGRVRAQVRVSFLPDGRKPVEQALALEPRRTATVAAPASIAKFGAGAIVEYAGGDVTVSRSVTLSAQGAAGVAAASCARPGTAGLVIPQGATLRADTQIAMLNPGSADALVDIALLVGGEKIEPESLQHRIVPARGRLVVREGDFVFDEPTVVAQIVARSGRVVADGVLIGSRIFELSPAQTAASELVAVASTARGATQFAAVAVGDEDAVTSGVFLSTTGQTTYEPLTNGLAPNTPRVDLAPNADVPAGPVALAATSSTAPLAIGARWAVSSRSGELETAASSGVRPARQAVVVLGPPALSGTMRLLLANPDDQDAILDLTLMTSAGPYARPALQGIKVRGGRTSVITFPGLPPNATVGIAILSRGGRVAAVLEALTLPPNAFSALAVTAVPVASVPDVAVEPDPIQGVPAQ
ncbi:MAG: DUF5719 family protein, partial [Actinomycetota bacterium]